MNKEINELKVKITSSSDSKEILYLRGKLISLIKNSIKDEKNRQIKTKLNFELVYELQKHKDHILKMKQDAKEKKYPISERVSLKIKEISTVIEIFLQKKDILGRLKVGVMSGGVSALFASAVSLGITLFAGGSIGIATLASLVPTACYLGLSSIISSMVEGTAKSKMFKRMETSSEDAKKELDFCKEYISDNKNFIAAVVKEPTLTELDEKINNEKLLIKQYETIIEKAPSNEIKQVITLEMIDVMKKLEYNYLCKENDYSNNKINLSNEEYDQLAKEKSNLQRNIAIREMFVEDTLKQTSINIAKKTGITYASRTLLSSIFPSLSFTNVTDALTPFLYTLLGNTFSMGKLSDLIKMKKTDYTGTIIKLTHPELFEKERKELKPVLQV